MNHVSIMGRLTADPKISETQEGKKIVRFRVAVPDGFSNNREPLAVFLNCVYFSKGSKDSTPENILKYCKKGQYIGVIGKLTTRSYISKADGLHKEVTEIQAFSIDYVFDRSNMESAQEEKSQAPNTIEVPDMVN